MADALRQTRDAPGGPRGGINPGFRPAGEAGGGQGELRAGAPWPRRDAEEAHHGAGGSRYCARDDNNPIERKTPYD